MRNWSGALQRLIMATGAVPSVLRRQVTSHSRDRMSMRRVIIKQGYLKKLPNSTKIGSTLRKPDRRWFIFGVLNNSDPYLEYYENEDGIFSNTPINMFFLDTTQEVIKDRTTTRHQNVFTLVLRDRHLTLVAPSRQTMFDWCRSIEGKLQEMGVLDDPDSDSRDYVMNVASRPAVIVTRDELRMSRFNDINSHRHTMQGDPTSSSERGKPQTGDSRTRASDSNPSDFITSPGMRMQMENYELVSQSVDDSMYTSSSAQTSDGAPALPARHSMATFTTGRPPASNPPQSMFETPPSSPVRPGDLRVFPNLPSTLSTNGLPPYSPVDTPSSPPYTSDLSLIPTTPVSPALLLTPDTDPGSPFSILSPKMREALAMDQNGGGTTDAVAGWNMPPPDADAPPLYHPRGALERGANKSLKFSQVEQLQKEMNNSGGVQMSLKKVDCFLAIAMLDVFGKVVVGGWHQKARPHLYKVFHIGDQVISINGQVVESSKMAFKLIDHCTDDDSINFITRRVPRGRIHAFKRDVDGESLGIRRRGGTAEVVKVESAGLATLQGMASRALTWDSSEFCNWWITEINHRPLNLFFKEDEIEKRLNAVGKDISILIQPMDFVQELKKQLKTVKNYKDFLVQ